MSVDTGLLRADAVVVGGGLAGLWAALRLPSEWDVLVIDKGTGPELGSSPWAQGGMAVAVGPHDSPELHANDTLKAGAGACDLAAVNVMVEEAPQALADLEALGCVFDRDRDGAFDLNREGGQSVARSVHATDATGREIMRVVVEEARKRARRFVGTATRLLVDDGRCAGVRITTQHGDVDVLARATLLAVGGCGALYEATTNPETATGDGLALAYDAGAAVADCEFVQFHPTALASPSRGPTALASPSRGPTALASPSRGPTALASPSRGPTALAAGGLRRVLLTEALRGEGAIVVDGDGKRFLFDAHPDGELGPRDVVARAIAQRAETNGAFLDARPIGAEAIRTRFPNITKAVEAAGFDLVSAPVPIAPAAHYFLGGVATDVWGRSGLRGLYAAGECAATGVHGANRMAGNSLTEAVVFGRRAALAMVRDDLDEPATVDVPDEDVPAVRAVRGDIGSLRAAMTQGAGLVRDARGLASTERFADGLLETATGALRAAATAAKLICRSALEREESRGTHFRSDASEPKPAWDGRHVTVTRATGE